MVNGPEQRKICFVNILAKRLSLPLKLKPCCLDGLFISTQGMYHQLSVMPTLDWFQFITSNNNSSRVQAHPYFVLIQPGCPQDDIIIIQIDDIEMLNVIDSLVLYPSLCCGINFGPRSLYCELQP
jgi:hypothetical protein